MADGSIDIKALAAQAAAQTGKNMNEASKGGGGDFVLPAEGPVRLRLISYVELGKHKKVFKGETKTIDKVALAFELSGPKHPPYENGDPQIIRFEETLSLSERAHFYKLFAKMNHDGTKAHMAEMLGEDFFARIFHNETGEGENKKKYANLYDKAGYSVQGPFSVQLDEEENEVKIPKPAEPLRSPLRVFIWEYANKAMWDSLFIEGEWEARMEGDKEVSPARSKNYYQNRIREALNFESCPIYAEVAFGGETGVPDAEKPAKKATGASADPLDDED